MNRKLSVFAATAAVLLALGVAFGAFGAHFLAAQISDHYLSVFKTGILYHFIHSLGLLAVISLWGMMNRNDIKLITTLFIAGIFLFSGSLYVISIAELLNIPGLKKLGMITPLGGLCFIIAWILTAVKLLSNETK